MVDGDARERSRRKRAPKLRQLTFSNHGGARRGAGRKPNGPVALVARDTRPRVEARTPILVTLKVRVGLPSLRRDIARSVVARALEPAKERFGARIVQLSIQTNHVHLLLEACDARALARSMQGFCVRLARGWNRAWRRKGSVFADRFHSRVLRTPREVRHALAYVLNNARRHHVHVGGLDPYSSGATFDGWCAGAVLRGMRLPLPFALPVARARSWLLACGWRRHGLISPDEIPGRTHPT